MKPIQVFILEDQPAMMRNLSRLIESSPKTELAGTAFSAEEAILCLDRLDPLPEIILCDIGLPKMTGTDFCRLVKVKYPEIELLMLTVYDDHDLVLEAIKRGAAGYLIKASKAAKS